MNLFRTQLNQRILQALVACTWIVVCGFTVVAASEPAQTEQDAERKERLKFMKQQAAEYEVKLNTSTPEKLTLHDDPVLRFSNPVGGVPDGIAVMWKDGQRPAIFAQVFQTKEGLWIHEFQSMAVAGLTLQRDATSQWSPEKAADDFRKLDDAPAAAASATQRLVQMKSLAGAFSATDDFKISSGDKETTRHALRMLTTPVYRYQDPQHGVSDAAVFAFVHGTDPEVFLVLEHRSAKEGAGNWFYCLTPMTCWGVNVSRRGKEVWNVPERLGKTTIVDPYFVRVHRPSVRP